MKKNRKKLLILVILFVCIFLFIKLLIWYSTVDNIHDSKNNNILLDSKNNIEIYGTSVVKENFSKNDKIPQESDLSNSDIIYSDDYLNLYDLNDFTVESGGISNGEITNFQCFNFVIEYKTDNKEIENKNFVYNVDNKYYYSDGFVTTGRGFLGNKNLEYINFNVEFPSNQKIQNIYYKDEETLNKLDSNKISDKIDYTNENIENVQVSKNENGETIVTTD